MTIRQRIKVWWIIGGLWINGLWPKTDLDWLFESCPDCENADGDLNTVIEHCLGTGIAYDPAVDIAPTDYVLRVIRELRERALRVPNPNEACSIQIFPLFYHAGNPPVDIEPDIAEQNPDPYTKTMFRAEHPNLTPGSICPQCEEYDSHIASDGVCYFCVCGCDYCEPENP